MDSTPKTDKRSVNFSKDEEHLLISLVEKYKNIIENKKSDVNTWKEKEKAWKKLEEEFNSQCTTNGRRSAKVLKEKFRNLKRKTKEKFSRVKVEMHKTGGGQYVPPIITEIEEAVKNIMGDIQVSGLPDSYDCDANFGEKTRQESQVTNKGATEDNNNYTIEDPGIVDPNDINFEIIEEITTEELSTEYFQDSDINHPHHSSNNLATECTNVDKWINSSLKSYGNMSAKETPPTKKIKLMPIKTLDPLKKSNINADHDWSTYCPKNLKRPVSTKLQVNGPKNQDEAHKPSHEPNIKGKKQGKKYPNAKLIEEKLEFVRIQTEKFLEEHAIKMQILKKQLELLEKGCKCWQRCLET